MIGCRSISRSNRHPDLNMRGWMLVPNERSWSWYRRKKGGYDAHSSIRRHAWYNMYAA
jgi:hypothetical protein